MRRLVLSVVPLVVLALAGCSGGGGSGGATGRANITAEGSTFMEPVMKVWADEYAELTDGRVIVNYKGSGSGAGVGQMTQKLADFGGTDAPMSVDQTAEARAAGGEVIHIPLVIGAVVAVYNVPGVESPLTFDGPLLAEIFTGKITTWDAPAIAKLNPNVKLPKLAVQPVYRADTSGTSFIFSDYLGKVSPQAKAMLGVSTKPNWPDGVGIAQPKSDGVAGYVGRTPGAVGYVELTYALGTGLTHAIMVNKAGQPVPATLESITAAAAATLSTPATEPPYSLHELTYNLTDAPGETSYPIAGMAFAVLYAKQPPGREALIEFLKWSVSPPAQQLAAKRDYAPLPADLQAAATAQLNRVEVQP